MSLYECPASGAGYVNGREKNKSIPVAARRFPACNNGSACQKQNTWFLPALLNCGAAATTMDEIFCSAATAKQPVIAACIFFDVIDPFTCGLGTTTVWEQRVQRACLPASAGAAFSLCPHAKHRNLIDMTFSSAVCGEWLSAE
jgi:hypothetical protein